MQKIKVLSIVFLMVITQSCFCAINYKRVCLFFDKDAEGPGIDKQQSLATTFAINIHQKASVAILSYSVLDAFLGLQYDPNPSGATKGYLEAKAFCKAIGFNPHEWNIFHCKDSQFFLFAPAAMKWATEEEKVAFNVEGTSAEFSFHVFKYNSLEQFSRTQNLRDWVGKKFNENKDKQIEISQLESMFYNSADIAQDVDLREKLKTISEEKGLLVKDDDVKAALVLSHTKPWNIFIQGHGSYEDLAVNQIASIAGLGTKKFQDLLLFLNRINTNLVAISSCYSGGKNLDYIQFKDILKQHKITPRLNYILAVLSSGDAPATTAYSYTSYSGSKAISLSGGADIKNFFSICETKATANWMTDALRNLARWSQDEVSENVPQILIPNGGWFQAFSPMRKKGDKFISRIQIIGNVSSKKHEIENKPIKITGKDVVLIYPELLPITLEISPTSNGFPQILSMIKGDAVHIIDSIQLIKPHKTLLGFIRDSFFELKGRRAKKTFFIKTLKGENGKFDNVFLQSWLGQKEVEKNGQKFLVDTIFLKLRYSLNNKYLECIFDGAQMPANLSVVEIKADAFNKPFQAGGPSPQDLDNKLARYFQEKKEEKREWKLVPRILKPAEKPQTNLQKKLVTLREKLENLKMNLAKLSNQLKRLRYTLQPQPVTAKSKKLADQLEKLTEQNKILKVCYDILNSWIKTPPVAGKDLQDKLVALGKNLSNLFTDSKINFAQVMTQKLSKDSLRVLLAGLFLLIDSNKNLGKEESTYIELAALSIALWKQLNYFYGANQAEINAIMLEQQKWEANNKAQAWRQNMIHYYQKESDVLTNIGQLKAAKNLHYFAAQLCIFFAGVAAMGLSKNPYVWIDKILATLDLSNDYRLKVVEMIISYQDSYKNTMGLEQFVQKDFSPLVQRLKAQYLMPK